MAPPAEIARVRKAVIGWYRKNHRVLQWRDTTDPWEVLLSEVMLQQTQVERVRRTLPRFLKRFPTLRSLARAPRSDVVREWKGMGYNNRAVRLHAAVRDITHGYGGRIPPDVERLHALPGIGKYTAHAVACFGFGARVPVVDVNVRRVLSRISGRMKTTADLLPEKDAWTMAREFLPPDAYTWNQALMDLGSVVCTARAPGCTACPVRAYCPSRHLHSLKPPRAPSKRKAEPGFAGIPRRIWRGRIVAVLRETGKSLTAEELGRLVLPSGKRNAVKFMEDVLGRLEADGVVAVRRYRGRTRVCLAA